MFSCFKLANGKCSLFKCSLVLVNLIFSLLGLVLLAGSLYVRFDSDWYALLKSNDFSVVYFMMGLGASITILSLVGMRGALKESKCLLCSYLVVVLLALVAQVFVASVLFRFNETVADVASQKTGITAADLTSFQANVVNQIGDSTISIYSNGKCATSTNTATTLTIVCTGSNSAWFQDFVNAKCTPASGNWATDKLAACKATKATADPSAVEVWCKCNQSISAELKRYSKPMLVTALVAAAVEVLLLLSAIYMVCCYNKRHAERENRMQERDQGYRAHQVSKPAVGNQSINMV